MLGNRPDNTLAEAESLTFDPPAGDTTSTGHISSPDLDMVSLRCRLAYCGKPISTRPPLVIKLFHQRLSHRHGLEIQPAVNTVRRE